MNTFERSYLRSISKGPLCNKDLYNKIFLFLEPSYLRWYVFRVWKTLPQILVHKRLVLPEFWYSGSLRAKCRKNESKRQNLNKKKMYFCYSMTIIFCWESAQRVYLNPQKRIRFISMIVMKIRAVSRAPEGASEFCSRNLFSIEVEYMKVVI